MVALQCPAAMLEPYTLMTLISALKGDLSLRLLGHIDSSSKIPASTTKNPASVGRLSSCLLTAAFTLFQCLLVTVFNPKFNNLGCAPVDYSDDPKSKRVSNTCL